MIRSLSVLAGLVLVVGSSSLFAQSRARAVPREFDHVRALGRTVSEFKDDRIQVVVAHYYSQSNHDSPWLLIELGALGQKPTRIERDQIELSRRATGRIQCPTPSGTRRRGIMTSARWAR